MLLVFGLVPPIPNVSRVLPSHVEHLRAMAAARTKYAKTEAQQRINRAKITMSLSSAESNVTPGEMVYAYGERLRQWVGTLLCE